MLPEYKYYYYQPYGRFFYIKEFTGRWYILNDHLYVEVIRPALWLLTKTEFVNSAYVDWATKWPIQGDNNG